MVDDAQWVDQASAGALLFAARRLDAEGVVLLFAARDGERRSFLAPGLQERHVAALEPASAGALLDETSPGLHPRVRARLVEWTAGNPLALVELPGLLTAGQRGGSEALPEPLPLGRGMERLFAERVASLPPDTRHLLLVGATEDSGDVATVLRAAATLGVGPTALAPAERAGLVSVGGGRLSFRHPLVRSAVYRGVPFAARQSAHRAVAVTLRGPEDVDRRAWHLAAAALGPDEAVAAALEASADRARRRSGVGAAADALERAAELTANDGERGRRLLAAAHDAWLAGQRDRAGALLAAAEESIDEGPQLARATQLSGLIELRRGTPERAYRLLVDGALPFLATDPHTALEALVLAAEAASFIGDPQLVAEVGRLALTVPPGPAREDRLMVTMLAGLAAALGRDPADGTARLREAVEGAADLEDPAHLLWAARAAWYLGELDMARGFCGRGADRARAVGAVGMLAVLLDRVACMDAIAGRASEAEANARAGLELAGESGLDAGAALASLALAGAIRGDQDACRSAAARAHEQAGPRHMRIVDAAADWALGLLALGLGRPAEALDRLLVLTGARGHPGILLWAAPDLVEAAARAGRPDDCRAVLAMVQRWAAGSGAAVPAATLARCRGLLSDGTAAVEHFRAALAHDPAAHRPFERARTELALGEALRRSRRRTEARTHLRHAVEMLEDLGAAPWAARARGELRATGETARKRDLDSAAQLTPQELQIARFAGDGASNPDIAAKLFLSRRTVEYHLHKVFAKLDVTSRGQLAGLRLQGP